MNKKIIYWYCHRYFNESYTHYYNIKLTGRYRYILKDGDLSIEVEIKVPFLMFFYKTKWVDGDGIEYTIIETSEIITCGE